MISQNICSETSTLGENIKNGYFDRASLSSDFSEPNQSIYPVGDCKPPVMMSKNNAEKYYKPIMNLTKNTQDSISRSMNNYFIPNKVKDTQNLINCGVGNPEVDPVTWASRNNMGCGNRMLYGGGPGTGSILDDTFIKKKEIKMFNDVGEIKNTFGDPYIQQLSRAEGTFNSFLSKNNEAPCEKTYVGPGIGVKPSVPSSGGFNAGLMNRVEPNIINVYKKNQLETRPGGGGSYISNLPITQSDNKPASKKNINIQREQYGPLTSQQSLYSKKLNNGSMYIVKRPIGTSYGF